MSEIIKQIPIYVVRTTGFVLFLGFWQLFSYLIDSSFFPSPTNTFSSVFGYVIDKTFFRDFLETILRTLIGFLLSALFGILLGYIIGSSRYLRFSTEGVIDFFRSIPVTSIYPIFVLLLGIDHLSKIGMVFWASFFIIIVNTIYGVILVSKSRQEMAKVYGASRFQIFRWVTFYESLPQVLIGLRIGISYALIVEILCEMFMGSTYGIGQKITEAYIGFSMSDLFALVIILGLIGLFFNKIFQYFEKKAIPWVNQISI